jgi:hypothetical protein
MFSIELMSSLEFAHDLPSRSDISGAPPAGFSGASDKLWPIAPPNTSARSTISNNMSDMRTVGEAFRGLA